MADADPILQGRLENPFAPGAGEKPPFMAGHAHARLKFEEIAHRILRGETKTTPMVLVGPRGCGKTVLLSWMRDRMSEIAAEIRDTPPADFTFIELTAEDGMSKADMCSALAHVAGMQLASVRVEKTFQGNFGYGGTGINKGSTEGEMRAAREEGVRIASLLNHICQIGKPIAITLDEAHLMRPEVATAFFGACQNAASLHPLTVAVAGTPDLPIAITGWKASYMERAPQFAIGNLSPEAAREALKAPLLAADILIDDDIVEKAAEEAQRYPFFLQHWGSALWEAMATAGGSESRKIGQREFDLAAPNALDAKTRLYEQRFFEIQNKAMLAILAEITLRIDQRENRSPAFEDIRSAARLYRDMTESPSETANRKERAEKLGDAMRALLHVGFIWKPPGEETVFGIPSLATHIRENAPVALASDLLDAAPRETLQMISGAFLDRKSMQKEILMAQLHKAGIDPDETADALHEFCDAGLLAPTMTGRQLKLATPLLMELVVAEIAGRQPGHDPSAVEPSGNERG